MRLSSRWREKNSAADLVNHGHPLDTLNKILPFREKREVISAWFIEKEKSGRRDLNPQLSPWEGDTLFFGNFCRFLKTVFICLYYQLLTILFFNLSPGFQWSKSPRICMNMHRYAWNLDTHWTPRHKPGTSASIYFRYNHSRIPTIIWNAML